MAGTDGSTKLAEALAHFDLAGMFAVKDVEGDVVLNVTLQDQNGSVMLTTGYVDRLTSIVWIQLPLSILDEIACQYGADQREDNIDTAGASTNAPTVPAEAQATAGTAQRRAHPCPQCGAPIVPKRAKYSAWLEWLCGSCHFSASGVSEYRAPWEEESEPWPDDIISAELRSTLGLADVPK